MLAPFTGTHHSALQKIKHYQWTFTALAAALLLGVAGALSPLAKQHVQAESATYYVSTSGNDANAGTETAPWRTVKKGLMSVQPGDTLMVRGGTYAERIQNPVIMPGTETAGITVKAYPGERPVVSGLLWLKGASYWTLDGINVTWASGNSASEHMTKMTDGVGWRVTNAEIWGARSYAGLLVAGAPDKWQIDNSVFHDTYPANSTNQDHLIYVNTNTTGGKTGVIERSLFYNSTNGRGIKIGPASSSTTPNGGVTVRYNTFYNNLGPSNLQLSYGASNNLIYRNIFQKPGSGRANVTDNEVNGTGNLAFDNIGWESTAVADPTLGHSSNIMRNPLFTSIAANDFRPLDTVAAEYGRYAPEGGTSFPLDDTEAPTVPSSLTVTSVTGTSAALSWTASTDNAIVAGYDIYRDGVKVGSTSATTYTATGLTALATYSFHVVARDLAGNVSPASDVVTVTLPDTTAPTKPTSLKVASVTANTVSLVWTASTDNVGVVGYNIYRSGVSAPVGYATTTSFTESGLVKGKSYTYTVKAVDAAGNLSSASSSVKATTR